jgi:hypothetical protein
LGKHLGVPRLGTLAFVIVTANLAVGPALALGRTILQADHMQRFAFLRSMLGSRNTLFAAGLLLGAGCGASEDAHVTYAKNVQTIFEPCTSCHRPGAPAGPSTGNGFDILNPFATVDGLLTAKNLWKLGHMEIDSPVYLVVPGNPDDSFLIDKISDPALGLLPGDQAGSTMPLQFVGPPVALTDAEKASIERWISEGAEDTDQFRAEVVPVIGDDGRFGTLNSGGDPKPGKCQLCHFANTPNPPDLSDPFGPNGLVNVVATYRSDMMRVQPFEPESSFLVRKIRAQEPGSEQGAPMPRSYPSLTDGQVETVRQWILDGARP